MNEHPEHGLNLLRRWSFNRRRFIAVFLSLLSLWVLASTSATTVQAHPLGEFTVNHYSHLRVDRDRVALLYVIDFAELSTLEQLREIDLDRDGVASDAEIEDYLDRMVPRLIEGLQLTIEGSAVEFSVERRSVEFLPGAGGFDTMRLELDLTAPLPFEVSDEIAAGRYRVVNFPGKLGWHEIVISGEAGIEIVETDALSQTVSNVLRDYPEIDEAESLLIYDVEFQARLGEGQTATPAVAEPEGSEGGVRSWLDRATDGAANLARPDALSPLAIALAMLGAFVWGAFHALTPGHGKAIVAAYLIGQRGTARHAAFLGLTVTATHTSSIFALGIVTLTLSHLILPEALFPWISVASGLLVIGIGASLGYSRYRRARHAALAHHHHDHDHGHDHGHHHHHDHTHDHAHAGHSHLPPGATGEPVTWRSLLALGISGGMVPCPSALLLLLGAISLNRLEFGLVLVVLFSMGLAAVLTGVGLLLVYARGLFDRFAFETRVPGLLPVASSAAITVAGVVIVAGALRQAGVL